MDRRDEGTNWKAAEAKQEAPVFRVAKWFPDLAPQKVDLLSQFHQELLKFNRTINLVSARTIDKADLIHFADSVLGAQLVAKHNTAREIFDFGSGNGFPAIVLAVLCPQLSVVMVESDRRKAEFLKHVTSALNLSSARVLVGRVEDIPGASVPAAMCRGFANLSKTLLISRKSMQLGASIFSLKGPEWSLEIASLPGQICSTWNTKLLGQYTLPETDIGHCVVVATKTK